ncbi:MAG: porin [Pseudomonadota bacterium]
MRAAVIAALGSVACLSTAAQAQSNVTFYGVLDMGMQSASTSGPRQTRLDSNLVAPSRFGFQGSEDLGSGLKATFRLEGGINPDTGMSTAGTLFGREANVGLQGDFGQVQVGLNYTPMFFAYVTYALGELNTFGWGSATNNFVYFTTVKAGNSIRYTSPQLGGVTVRAIYSLGNEGAAGQPEKLGNTTGVGANYKLGAFTMDVDYVRQNYAATAALTPTTPVDTATYYLVGALYDFGFVKTSALYQRHTGSANVLTPNTAVFANPNNHYYELSALFRAGGTGKLLFSFGQYKKQASSSGDATSYALRYDYLLSRRTGLYTGIARMKNNSAASFTVSNAAGPGVTTTPGVSVNSVALGMVTRF